MTHVPPMEHWEDAPEGDVDAETARATEFYRLCFHTFLRDLPHLLTTNPGEYVAYAGDQQVAVCPDVWPLRERVAHYGPGNFQIYLIAPPDEPVSEPSP